MSSGEQPSASKRLKRDHQRAYRVLQHFLQVLLGLIYLHKELRVIHRDIKPSNLLLNSAGQLKISDFGVSGQLANSVSRCESWVGTITYMSPERIRGDEYSANCDVWSLGLCLMEFALGRFPYVKQVWPPKLYKSH